MNADDGRKLRSYLRACALICGLFVLLISGCGDGPKRDEVVLYTSVDQPIARPIIQAFEKQSGIRVVLVTDTEATKSVGLAERLRAEKANVQSDVWWGNEPFHTINLANEGLLQPHESSAAKDVDARFKDAGNRWAGVGLRARVVAVSGDAPVENVSLEDFRKPPSSAKITMARPTAGTTGGHVASLYVLWGDEKADEFFSDLHRSGIQLLGGNGPVAEAVGRGQFQLGLTDNDDVHAARREGGKLVGVLPDQDSIGTLAIPTTVGLVAGAKHPDAAKQLIDYLLSAEVEKQLIDANFAGWSVRGASESVKWMDVNYDEVAQALPRAVRRATAILEGRVE